ncbi:DUF6928 family protein [Gordonia phthalatica]|uniref:Uncharacterized protein n=1 Tax=Gordonia phthalatica TaxID=1136941 RepID=A0A0N9NEX6_9ACTN|nr:hypothetical protein [Gordonia phthalatica]ALG83805.1 hypothetical protein ACH46_03900 [Gordonia phthalatica]
MLPNISVLWFVDCDDPAAELRSGVSIDPAQTTSFIEKAFANTEITAIGTSDLGAAVGGADNRVFAAHFGSLAVLAGHSLRTADPNELTAYLADLGVGHTWALISVDPGADIGCFARWDDGDLHRAFAGTSTSIKIDAGLPHPFEGPYWAGEHPQPDAGDDPLALPFHPGALADAANREWFGFGFRESEPSLDPARIPVTVYRVGPDDGRDQFVESSVPLTGDAADVPEVATPEAGAEETEPIERVVAPAATFDAETGDQTDAQQERTPGPISRYFGFRGRL